MQTYPFTLGHLKRNLPIIPVSDTLSIASFVMLGDTELIETAADALIAEPRFPRTNIDLLVCPEAKAIPLTHALAVRLKCNYVVVRKTVKTYMNDPIVESVSSITTTGSQNLVLDDPERKNLNGKRVCIIDDVVSTGGSLVALEKLLSRTGCTIIARAAVLLEEGGYTDDDLIYLQRLPIFPRT